MEQILYLINSLLSPKEIIDLICRSAPGPEGDEWDGNVGVRMLNG